MAVKFFPIGAAAAINLDRVVTAHIDEQNPCRVVFCNRWPGDPNIERVNFTLPTPEAAREVLARLCAGQGGVWI